jgi:hypothetical protein
MRVGGVAQVGESLLSKNTALSSHSGPVEGKKGGRKEGRKKK